MKSRIRKTKKGGMSAKRYQRNRDAEMLRFFRKTAKYLNEELLPIIDEVDAIVVGGNTIRAKDFLKRGGLDYRLMQKVHPEIIVAPVDKDGLQQAMKEVARIMTGHELAKEQKVWDEFITALMKDKATYGKDHCIECLQNGRVAKMLVHESKINEISLSKDTMIFSSDTETGQQLLSFGGIAAILRW